MTRAPLFSVLVLLLTTPASAQETVSTTFDFETVGPDQTGMYDAGDGAEVAGGVGRVATLADWHERGQLVRVAVDVDNMGSTMPRAVVPVGVSLLDAAFRGRAALDGEDVTAYLADGTTLDRPLASGITTPSGRGTWHVRVPTLSAGMSSLFLYAGDRSGAATVDELVFFTDPAPVVRYFALGAFTATDAVIVSMVASNSIVVMGATESLALLETRSYTTATLGTEVLAAGPIAGSWLGAGGDSLPPESFAGTSFITPTPRYDEDIFVAAPFGDATITFSSPSLAGMTVPMGTVSRITTLAGDTSAIVFDTDVPVLLVRGGDSVGLWYDVSPVPPATRELLGVVSGNALVAAGPMGASVTVTRSDGTTQTVTVPANAHVLLTPPGTQGSGPAVRLDADEPIGAMTYGDGDGGECVHFLPPHLLGRELVMPFGAQFVAIATALPNTSCRLLASDGTEIASGTSGPTAPPAPGKIFFGSTTNGLNLAGPATLRCSNAVWALAEDASSETEKMLISAVAHRPHSGGDVTLSAGAVETRFTMGIGWASTPSLAPTRPIAGIRSLAAMPATEFGSDARFQVSTDGALSWMVPDGAALAPARVGEGAPPGEFAGVRFAPTGALSVRVLLETDGVADASVDDIVIEAELVPPPVRFSFSMVASPQNVGVPIMADLSAVDADGAVVTIGGDVDITSEPLGVFDPQTVTLVDGVASVSVTPASGASMTFIVATQADLGGSSNPFEVVAGSSAGILRVESGDGQTGVVGTTVQRITVSVTDADGAPIEGAGVLFVPMAGAVDVVTATTDASGRANSFWTLGPIAGPQTLTVSLALDPTVSVVVGATATAADGGCDATATSLRGDGLEALFLLAGLLLFWRRRGR